MAFVSRAAEPPVLDRSSLPVMMQRLASSRKLQENKAQVLVMGSDRVGKTTMIEHFSQRKVVFEDESDINTNELQVEIIVELMEVHQSLEAHIRKFVIQTAHAYILMYSMDDPKSFRSIAKMIDEIEKIKGPGMPTIVVGNKADISQQKSCKTAKGMNGDKVMGDIPHIQVSFAKKIHINEVYRKLFEHHTLRKLMDIVSKIKSCTVFNDFRSLSRKAEDLERTAARIFPKVK